MISEAFSFRLNCVAIWLAPFCRNTRKKDTKAMVKVLSLDSQATMIAVKPRPPAVLVEMVWLAPETSMKPARPHIAPEMAIVRRMTFLTEMPA